MNNIQSKTKIIATIGTASSSKEILKKMFVAGVDVCRLNFSHGTHEDHLKVIKNIRELNAELQTNVAILVDLQGPKLRIGEVENNCIELKEGDEIMIVSEKCIGTNKKLYLSYQDIAKDIEAGEAVLIDDGKIKLQVIETNKKDTVKTKVIYGGPLSSNKGFNLPDTKISLPSLTEKDIDDAYFALDNNADFIGLSFIRSVTDIVELKQLIKKKKKHTLVIAKIEKPEALQEIDNIIDMADGVMVARGDLGVEVSFDRVPLIQKDIVQKCINRSKPVIIATQMMESMITNFRPTRAEATDVANAVIDGADALMLSAETSVGKYPIETIISMQKIIDWTENYGYKFHREHPPKEFSPTFLADSICYNAHVMAQQTKAKAIITFTFSGYTAYRISSYRPKANIFAFTSNNDLLPKMSLLWGVEAFLIPSPPTSSGRISGDNYENIDDAINYTIEFLKQKGYIKHEDIVIHIGSTPLHQRGKANMLKLSYV